MIEVTEIYSLPKNIAFMVENYTYKAGMKAVKSIYTNPENYVNHNKNNRLECLKLVVYYIENPEKICFFNDIYNPYNKFLNNIVNKHGYKFIENSVYKRKMLNLFILEGAYSVSEYYLDKANLEIKEYERNNIKI